MDQPGSKQRSRPSTKRALLIGIPLLLLVAFGLSAGSRVLFAPWSIGLFGRDTLTGNWVGTLRAHQGAQYGLHIDLRYRGRRVAGGSHVPNTSHRANLQGTATLCAPTGERYEYTVTGYADRSGAIDDLWLEYGDPTLSALNLHLSGEWESPALSLTTNKNPFLPDGRFVANRTISSADPDDSFAPLSMSDGDDEDLEAICQRIRQ